MIIAVPREIAPGECRVSLSPESIQKLKKRPLEVVVESGAGDASNYSDGDYLAAGARIETSTEGVYRGADLVLKVREPRDHEDLGKHEVDLLPEGSTLITTLSPLTRPDVVRRLRDRKICSFAMDLMPRITRAQSMDSLSSMSSIAGYKAVLLAADRLPRYFPMFMTAAGTITAARVLILGAGVAGLQAIATAKRLGAIVEAFDVRPVVKEQVESLGGRFIELPVDTSQSQDQGGYAREQTEDTQARILELLAEPVRKADVVITTALIPGKPAPLLLTADMARSMRSGSVIVDLAAEAGGNCELTEADQETVHDGVRICGPTNLPSQMATQASQLYSRNIYAFVEHLLDEEGEKLHIDTEDELTLGPLVTRDGEVVHERTRQNLEGGDS